MLTNTERIDTMSEIMLQAMYRRVEDSPYLPRTKIVVIQRLIQEIVNVWTSENFV